MKKIIFFCVILLLLSILNVKADALCELVMDADSGRIIYGKNIDEPHLIASTTKIMTALVVLNNSKIDDIVTVGNEVTKAYGSAIYIKPGEKLTVLDLLYGLMLRSGNDAAIALAVHVGGSIDGFAKMMMDTASSIGMKNTTFLNPHGLDEETKNLSTVYDMALLMREAMKNKTFREITSTKTYKLKTNFNNYIWQNKNKLLTSYEYATGGKIGYTIKAKHTFVSSASKNGKNLIVASFIDDNQFLNHKNLYEKYFEKYDNYKLIDKNRLNISYKKGMRLFTLESFNMLLTEEESKRVNREVSLYENVRVEENANIIGSIAIELDGKIYKRLNIYAENTIKRETGLLSWIKRIFKW